MRSKVSFTIQMIEDYQTHSHMMIGVQKVEKDMVTRYGIAKSHPHSTEIENIIEKTSIDEAHLDWQILDG